MPIFVFRCLDCGGSTEALLRRGDDQELLRCNHCGGGHLSREGYSSMNFGDDTCYEPGAEDGACSGCPFSSPPEKGGGGR